MADDNSVLGTAQRRWETQVLNPALAKGARPATIPPAGSRSDVTERRAPLYTPLDDTGRDYLSQVGFPGE